MSRSLGVLTLDLIAKTGGFTQELDRASGKVKSTARDVDGAARSLDRMVMAAGAAGVAIIGATAAIASRTSRAMDEMGKLAQSTGLAVAELSALTYVADQNAVSQQNLVNAMSRLTKGMSDAQRGTGDAMRAFEALGISVTDTNGQLRSADDVLVDLAEEMSKLDDGAQKTALAIQVFGRSGAQLIPLLNNGRQGIKDLADEARKFGIVMDADAVAAATRFNDNLTRMAAIQQGVAIQLTTAILPAMEAVTNAMVSFAGETGTAAEKVEFALKAAGVAATAAAAIFAGRLAASLFASVAGWVAATAEIVRYQAALARMAGLSATAAAGIGAVTVAARAASLALGLLGGPVGAITVALGSAATGFLLMGRSARDAASDVDALGGALDGLTLHQLKATQAKLGDSIEDAAKEMIKAQKEVEQLEIRLGHAEGALFRNAGAVNDLKDKLIQARSEADSASQKFEELSRRSDEVTRAIFGTAAGVRDLGDALTETDEASKKFLERLIDQSIIAGLKTQREQLDAMVAAGKRVFSPEDLKKAQDAADHIDRMSASTRTATKKTDAFATSLKSLLDTHLPHNKALNDLNSGLAILDRAHKTGKVSAADYEKAIASVNAAYDRQIKDLLPESVKKANEQVKAAQDQIKALQQQVRTYGMAESAVMRLAVADTDAAIATLESAKASEIAGEASADRVREIELQIEALTQLRELQTGIASEQQNLEFLTHQQQTWDQWARDVEQIFDRVGQSLTDAIFDGGKSGKELLKDIFKSLTFNVLINPIMGALQGSITNSLGGLFGFQNPSQQGGIMGAAQNASSMNTLFGAGYQALTGASAGASPMSLAYANTVGAFGGDPIGALISANGGWEGALSGLSSATSAAISAGAISAAPSVVASLSTSLGSATMATTSFSASLGGGAAAAGAGGAAAGSGGLLAGISAAAPWVAGGLAIASAFGLFDDEPKTRHGKSTVYELTDDDSIYRKHDEMRHETAYYSSMEQMTQATIDGIKSTFDLLGVDASLGNLWSRTDISETRKGDGVSSGGAVIVGDKWIDIGIPHESDDTKYGFGGWSDEPVLPRLAVDLQLTMLEAFQAASEQLPAILSGMLDGVDIRGLSAESAQALITSFDAIMQQVSAFQSAVERLPFETLRDLSFDAAANLIGFAGGLEALDAGMTSYFQNFYTEAEQLEWHTQQMGSAFESLGLTMPDVTSGADAAKTAYRELVESLDLTTEEGQKAYAMLMTLSGGFADLVAGMDELDGAAQQLLEREREIAAERMNLMQQMAQAVGNASVMRRAELDALDESNHALQMLIWAYQDAVAATNAAYSAVQRLGQEEIRRLQGTATATDQAMSALEAASRSVTTNLQGVFNLLQTSVRDLRGEVEATSRMQYTNARATISTALVTGQVSDADAMQLAIRAANEGVASGIYASKFEQDRAYLTLAAEMEQLQGITGKELTAAQETLDLARKQLDALRGVDDSINSMSVEQAARALDIAMVAEEQANVQIAIIEEQLSWAEQQYNALRGLGDQFSTFAGAIDGLASAIKAEQSAKSAVNNAINTPGLSREQQYLINNPDVAAEYITDPLANSMGQDAYARWHWDTYGKYEGAGRESFAVGTPFVPHDMTADIHRGEIIIDPRSSDVLRKYGIQIQGGGGNSAAVERKLDALLAHFEKKERQEYQDTLNLKRIANNTEDTATALRSDMKESEGFVVEFA